MLKQSLERDIAAGLKKRMDRRYGGMWHCVVGRSFGTYVSHDARSFICFSLDHMTILLFRYGGRTDIAEALMPAEIEEKMEKLMSDMNKE